MALKPWREIAEPHTDVRGGKFQQAEFAADLSRVHAGTANAEYQNPALFFQRTFITEGMRLLLDSVAKRLAGNGGDPVIQLQTAFGGGKTHTMLAVYHLAKGEAPASDLQGVPAILDAAALGFLGLGAQPPMPEWGTMLASARDYIERVAPLVRRSRAVSLHGIGEPLANPHLFDTVRWCDATTSVSFVSNALLFNAARIQKVLAHDVALVDFSLDAGTAATYRKIRHNDFDKAVGNIRRLIEERDRRGLKRPRIGINMCLMRENVADVPACQVGRFRLKGKRDALALLALDPKICQDDVRSRCATALQRFSGGDAAGAQAAFDDILARAPDHGPARFYAGLCAAPHLPEDGLVVLGAH